MPNTYNCEDVFKSVIFVMCVFLMYRKGLFKYNLTLLGGGGTFDPPSPNLTYNHDINMTFISCQSILQS